MITTDRSIIGIGLYDAMQATRIIRVGLSERPWLPSYDSVRRWIRGWPGQGRGRYEPVVSDELPDDRRFTFTNLIELWFVSLFRSEGVSLQVIRRSADEVAKILGHEHPLAFQRFYTDGRSIFAD